MKKVLVSFIAVLMATGIASAFGAREHKAIAIIAENHLTPKAAAAVREITGGERLAVFASHPDRYRSYFLIDGRKIWHTYHLDAGMKPEETGGNSLFRAIEMGTGALAGEGYRRIADKDSAQIYLAYIVHFIGDMHCPGHVKYPEGMGNPSPKKYIVGEKTIDFHKCWDSQFISEAFNVSTMDMVYISDIASPEEIAEYQKGGLMDWADDTAHSCYDLTHDGDVQDNGAVKCTPHFVTAHALFAKHQAMKAGYRLAAYLNAMFE